MQPATRWGRWVFTENDFGLVHAFAIIGVYHINNAMRLLIVFVPQRLQFLLATQVPEIQTHALHIDGANVETHCCCDFSWI